jgi:RNA polymerase sigma factor (sigma-70 family)
MGAQPLTRLNPRTQSPIAFDASTSKLKLSVTAVSYEERLTDPALITRIARIARKQTRGSQVDWEDAFQSAQIKLIAAIRAGKFTYGTKHDFDRWAATVARFEIIDLVRRSKCRGWDSTDRLSSDHLTVLDTIADSFNPMATLEQADLVFRVRKAIIEIDRLYPDRSYYQLWLGKVNDKKQAEIAEDLGVSQSAISKRWQELLARLAIELDLDGSGTNDRTRSEQTW